MTEPQPALQGVSQPLGRVSSKGGGGGAGEASPPDGLTYLFTS